MSARPRPTCRVRPHGRLHPTQCSLQTPAQGAPIPHSHRDPGPTPTRPRGCVRPLFGLDLPWCAPVGRLGRLGRAQPTLVARRGGACAAAGERGQGGRRRLSCRRCRRRRRRPAARWPGPARRAPGRAAASAWTAWRPAAACERRTFRAAYKQRTSDGGRRADVDEQQVGSALLGPRAAGRAAWSSRSSSKHCAAG